MTSWAMKATFALLIAAGIAAGDRVDDWMVRGDATFDDGAYQTAADSYSNAERRTTDPGLVAFNKAAALYRLGRYSEAELYYVRCLEDAAGDRLPRALYNLANSRVQQAGDADAVKLKKAIADYETCLHVKPSDPELADNAQTNLQLARALLVRAKAKSGSRPDSEKAEPGSAGRRDPGEDLSRTESPDSRRTPERRPTNRSDRWPIETDQVPPPGKGNLPPIPDRNALAPMSLEETAAYLQQLADRIARERQQQPQRSTYAPSEKTRDW